MSGDSLSGHSRRRFLASTAGGAALAAFGASEVVFADRPISFPKPRRRTPLGEDETIRVGVVGTGGMGTGHCHAIVNLVKQGRENAEIVALCDVCDLRMQNAKQHCEKVQGNEIATYRNYEDLINRDDIHAVLIATTEHSHAHIARDAILAGKDVYCEKPMTLTLEDAFMLYKLVHENSESIFQIGTQKIILPKYLKAREVIRSGRIGKPVFSQTSYCRNTPSGEWNYYGLDSNWDPKTNLDWARWCYPFEPEEWDPLIYARWRRYKKYSTGIVGDLLVHEVTPMVMALEQGWPTKVQGMGGHYIDKEMENHDQVNLTVQFEKEHTMVVAGSTCNEVGLENLIRGHEGNIYLNSRHCEVRPTRPYVDEFDPERIECPDIGNDQDELRVDWLNSVRTRQPNVSTIDLATKMMVIVNLATRSMWDGHTYEFDPVSKVARRVGSKW